MTDLSVLSPALRARVEHSLSIVYQALDMYKPGELSISYNGGKDSCVMVHLLHLALTQRSRPLSELFAIYFKHANSFPEVTAFAAESADKYGFKLFISDKPYKSGLEQMMQEQPRLRAIFMGTRRGDPHGASLVPFAPTDPGWPPLMRVNAILDWTLYEKGYTSIGLLHDTEPNTKLRNPNGSYRPAWELEEDLEERAGRSSKSSL